MSELVIEIANKLREVIGTEHCQLFNCPALVNDPQSCIFNKDKACVMYCGDYGYCDVLGLSDFEYKELAFILSNEKNFIVEW